MPTSVSTDTPNPTVSRILVADDSAVCRGVLVILLENAGYEVVSVFDGVAALRALREQPFDLAILDNDMPNLDGLAALGQLREFLPDLPVLVYSGTVTLSQAASYRDLRVEDLIVKPVDPRALRDKVARLFARNKIVADQRERAAKGGGQGPDDSLPSPLVAGASSTAQRMHADLIRLSKFRSVAIVQGNQGSGRFEIALNIVPSSGLHKPVCRASKVSSETLAALLAPAQLDDKPVLLVVLDADQLTSAAQALLEELVRGTLADYIGMTNRLRLVLCSEHSLDDLDFNEFLLLRATTSTLVVPDFAHRREDWADIAEAILNRCSAGHGTFSPDALEWLKSTQWPGNYLQLHRTIELARHAAGLGVIIQVVHLETGKTQESVQHDPLFHELLLHVHGGGVGV